MAEGETSLENLSDDEMYNILKRLRAGSLCKMSTLSSTWKVLLKDPHLINLHRAWSKLNPLLLIVTNEPSAQNHIKSNDSLLLISVDPADGAVTYQVRLEIRKDDIQVLSSGAGCSLFCIRGQEDFIIFNATTREIIQTLPQAHNPPLGIAAEYGSIRSRRNVNPRPILPYVVATGFGYIESRHVYVLIKLFLSHSCQILMLSETGEIDAPWRILVQNYPRYFSPDSNGVMVGNKCYWMKRDIMLQAKLMQISPSKMSILCLHVESETFHKIRYPDFATYDELVDDMQLGDLKDQLCFGYSHGNPLVMDIWVLKDEQNSDWNIEYRVDLSLIGGMDDRVVSEVKFMGYWEGEQGGVLMFHDPRQQELVYYSTEERRFKTGKRIQVGNHVSVVFPYSESFNSIRRAAAR